MKIAYNPKTAAALTTAPANNDITFDLRGLNIFVRGERFKGTDTTYSVFRKHTSSGSGGYNGLVPVPSYTTTTNRFLREDGSWIKALVSSDLANYVTTNTAQTITGSKTFSQSINISDDANNNGYKQYGVTILRFNGTSASSNSTILSANGGKIYFRPGGTINTSYEATLDANGKFTAPKLSINGGTASQFLKADGSVDSNTYLTTSSADNRYVTITTKQNITGEKTFKTGYVKVESLLMFKEGSTTKGICFGPVNDGSLRINYHENYGWKKTLGHIDINGGLKINSIISKGNNDFIVSNNEFNFVPSKYSGTIHINHRTQGGYNGAITEYLFKDGNQGYASVRAKSFIKQGSSDDYVLLGGGNHKKLSDISSDHTHYIGTTATQATSKGQALTGITSINGRLTINAESDLTRLGFGAAHHVVFGGDPFYQHRSYYFRPDYGSQGVTNCGLFIQNASASPPTYSTTHSFDHLGNASHIGGISVGGNRYYELSNIFGLNLNNSDIVNVNCFYFADACDGAGEGINFYRNSTHWDTLSAANGVLYFNLNREKNTNPGKTPVFSALSNSGNNISLTIGGQNRTLTVGYASNAETLGGQAETAFYRKRGYYGTIANSIPTASELATNNGLNGSWYVQYTGASGHLIQFNAGGSTGYVQFYSKYDGSLLWRNSTNATLSSKPWKTIVDSTNYTGIVLKIGKATRGSAGLPIYLNAGTPTVCSTTLGVSITGNAATATKLQTARTINGTSFNGTANITTAYWGATRTITLSGAVTGSASVNGSQNVTITTTYQTGSIDGRYVGGNKTANHGSSGTAYTADSYSSTFAKKEFVAFAERGSWAYANNGYVTTDTGVNIPLAGTAVFQWGASDTNKTQLFITPHNNSGVSNPAANEMLFYTSNGSGYTSAWTRVLTHRNYTAYTVTKTGGGASGTWGISITGNAATATTAQYLASNSRMDYGWNGLNYFNISGTAGTAAKVNNTPTTAWWHILRFNHANSTGYYTDLAIPFHNNSLYYKRVNSGALVNGKWVRILDELNYTTYVNPTNYVTALGTKDDYVTWTKNGTTNNLTVPYATKATKANRLTLVSCYNGTTNNDLWSTIKTANNTYVGTATIYEVYNDGGPTTYGEVLDIVSMHGNHWQPQLWFDSGKTGSIRHRNKDYNNATWGSWYVLLDSNNYSSTLDNRYVTLATNQTVSGIKTFSKQQKFTVATGTSPFTVTSNTMVANLNSDLLDGKHLGNTVGKIPYIVDFPSYTSFGSSTNSIDYAKNILKWVWTNQNHGERTLLIGVGHPNSIGNLQIQLYGAAGVDSAGYPRYSSAIYYPLNARPIYFGTNDYKFYNHSLAFYEDIKNPANYYWANIKVSASSSTSTSPTFSTAYTSNWFRSTGSTGWYNETHAGGIYMSDTNYVRVFNSKKFYVANTTSNAILTEGGIQCNSLYANKSAKTNAGGISLYSNNDPMTYGIAFRTTGGLSGHGAVTGDWATYFTMNDNVNRGWIFRRSTTNVASISGSGTAYFNGSLFPGQDVILKNEGYVRGKDTSGNLRNLIRVDSTNWNIFGNTDLPTNVQGKHLTFSISGLTNLVSIESTGMNCSKTVTASGFVKQGSSNNYVLLGGGGHKLLSDIFSSYNLYASNVSNYSSNMAVYYTVIGVGKFITIYGHINGTGTSSTEDKQLAYNVNIYNPAGNGRAGATISKGGGNALRYVTIYAYNGQLRIKWYAMDTTMNYTYFSFSYFNT